MPTKHAKRTKDTAKPRRRYPSDLKRKLAQQAMRAEKIAEYLRIAKSMPDRDAYTVQEVAKAFGKDDSRIRLLCIDENFGELIAGRVRLLSRKDVLAIARYLGEHGRDR